MFTGIIEALGVVRHFNNDTLAIEAPSAWKALKIGSSVAVQGVCLTVVKKSGKLLFFDVIGETKARTVLSRILPGQEVNLERAMKMGSRFEGHRVLGHVDGTGRVIETARRGRQISFRIAYPKAMKKFLVEKGSVAVNGVSMTLGKVGSKGFWVHAIPHTLKQSNFGELRTGDDVNLEGDIVAKFASLD